jgi:mono/diheme cytochrome c family protein
MKAGFWKVALLAAVMTLALAACASGGTTGGASPTTSAGGDAGGATGGNAAGGDAASPTTAAGGDAGAGAGAAANCAGVDTTALVSSGQAAYSERCASCHGAQGEGQGDFPAIAGNTAVTGDDVAGLVNSYFAVDAHPKDVTPEQLAGLFSYARSNFGNTAAVVCPSDITVPAP